MAITRRAFNTFLVSFLLLQLALAAATPASSRKISAFPLASLQGSESGVTGIAEVKRRNLKGGGGGRGGAMGIGSRGFRGGGIGYHARSAAVALDHSLRTTTSAVSVSSLIIIVFLV